MHTHVDKIQENKIQAVANAISQKQNGSKSTFQFVDNRPEAVAQRKLQEVANNRPRVTQLRAFQDMTNDHAIKQEQPVQKKENNTGLPDNLKSGIENLSGYSMDDIKVHYNSDKPAQLNAHAYAQGTNIHIASGQEKHLPHEAWHVVQQKQGRVKPTRQMKGEVNVNDDAGLEKEADFMGKKALSSGNNDAMHKKGPVEKNTKSSISQKGEFAIQRKLTDGQGEPLSDASIEKLKELFLYRHGKADFESFHTMIDRHQEKEEGMTLENLVDEVKGNKDKKLKRVSYLLSLILHQFQDWTGNEKTAISGNDAWDTFEKGTNLIRSWVRNFPLLNEPGVDEEAIPLLHPELAKFNIPHDHLGQVTRIKQDQWQAAAVAERRAGRLSTMGFLELKRALEELTSGSENVIKLRLSRDVVHEGFESGPPKMVKVGTVEIPKYAVSAEASSKALRFFSLTSLFKSGKYSEKFKVILKELDVGHKFVDQVENVLHRKKGAQVDAKVDFSFLALLSPKDGSQEVMGANGQVLGDGSYMFTIDPSFRVRYMPAANYVGEGGTAKNFFQFIPHSQLASLGAVVAAGNFVISKGKFVWVDNGSGHYRVTPSVNTSNAKAGLKNLGYDISGVRFLSRSDGELDDTYKEGNAILDGLPEGEHRPVMTPEIQALQRAMDQMKSA